jgi:hypothetical protein
MPRGRSVAESRHRSTGEGRSGVRRVGRYIVNVLAVVAAALALAAAVAWGASYWRTDHVAYGYLGGRISADNPRGWLLVWWFDAGGQVNDDVRTVPPGWVRTTRGPFDLKNTIAPPVSWWRPVATDWDRKLRGWDPTTRHRLFMVRCWLLMLAFGVLPAVQVRRWWRRRRRFADGCCPSCGYDLRATPGRCPECGTTKAAA